MSEPAVEPAPLSQDPWYIRHRMRALLLIFVCWMAFCLTVFVIVSTVFIRKVRVSEPFALVLAQVQDSPEAELALGVPIEAGLLTLGSVDEDRGYSELTLRVSGPKDKATVRAIVEKPNGTDEWVIVYLSIGVMDEGGGYEILLVNDKPPTGPKLPEPTEEAKKAHGVSDDE